MKKSFGRKRSDELINPVHFEFTYQRDDVDVTENFTAYPRNAGNHVQSILAFIATQSTKAVPKVVASIAQQLNDKDGTPAKWKPKAVEGEDKSVSYFRGPDGETYPEEYLDHFEAYEAGSSRRRWLFLMNQDDSAVVESDDIVDLFKELLAEAAGRPTSPSH